jgi:hypothetical protein
MPHYAVRVTHSWLQAQSVAHTWALRADKVLVYEHSQETKTARDKTHIHMLLVNTSIDKKQLRNLAKETNVPTKGNENMSFKMAEEPFTKYITYMSKGVLQPKYNKGFTPEELEEYRLLWVDPNEYKKETAWSKLYDEWVKQAPPVMTPCQYATVVRQYMEDPALVNHMPPNPQDEYIRELERNTMRWMMKYHNYYYHPSIGKQVTSLRYTHCWKNGLSIPKNRDGTARWKL